MLIRSSRTLKPIGTTYPVFRKWLLDNNMLSVIQGEDMLSIPDPTERQYVADFLEELQNRTYTDLFRRDYMCFTKEQATRQLKSFFTSTKRMLNYHWDDPDRVERNLAQCSGYMCRFKDLTVADLIHGSSTLEHRKSTRLKSSHTGASGNSA